MSNPKSEKAKRIEKAQSYLRINEDSSKSEAQKKAFIEEHKDAIIKLGKSFERDSNFTYARRLFQLVYQYLKNVNNNWTRKLAVYTYKDTDLTSDVKYNAAADLLISNFEKDGKITIPNVLGTLGSIYKKKWKYENHDGHLYQSLRYYLQGYNIASLAGGGHFSDIGFCGINLAFIYDLLANLESYKDSHERDGVFLEGDEDPFERLTVGYSQEAVKYRKGVRDAYTRRYEENLVKWETDKKSKDFFDRYVRYWFFVTWGEALLGLGDFEEATKKFESAVEKVEGVEEVPLWQRYSASFQGFQLIEILYGHDRQLHADAQRAIKVLLGVERILEFHNNKLGLALSGGGFRASLFHIGMMAKLAEADLLRKVEVISCVSGGSILGAFYYLKLKEMLEQKNYHELGKQDYIDLVADIEKDFLKKINRNVRLNILAHPWANIKMALKEGYSRTDRTADLYDRYLYNDLLKTDFSKILMKDLLIFPGGDKSFRPERDNWMVDNKVPILILNATTLNTGHSWQFTATWMGESPAYINSEFDALPNLRRMYYDEAPPAYQDINLSTAVAASAGVPGLFAPIEFNNLYDDYTKVLLVDGGVHDNQGVSTLYEQDCNMIIASDASGQMTADQAPPNSELGVFARTNGILQERIRFSQFRDLESRKKSGVIRDYILMHFTKDLPSRVVNWKDSKDPYMPAYEDSSKDKRKPDHTNYKIKIALQEMLAGVRTDLDAFHETEAYALMYSAYQMTQKELEDSSSAMFKQKGRLIGYPQKNSFLDIHSVHEDEELSKDMERKLGPSSMLFGKVFRLSKLAFFLHRLVLLLLVVGVVFLVKSLFGTTLTIVFAYVGAVIVALAAERWLSKKAGLKSLLLSVILFLPILSLIGLVSWLVRKGATSWYLSEGRLPEKKK